MVKDPERGFTVAHLLTTMIRKQDNAHKQLVKRSLWTKDLDLMVDHHLPYDHFCIVAVTRTDAKHGAVRWLPELEVHVTHVD